MSIYTFKAESSTETVTLNLVNEGVCDAAKGKNKYHADLNLCRKKAKSNKEESLPFGVVAADDQDAVGKALDMAYWMIHTQNVKDEILEAIKSELKEYTAEAAA